MRLRVTSKGQILLTKEMLDHLRLKPGDDVEVDLLPNGRVSIRVATN
jgi:AbrB family looped-hinge helix DNA binding protein